MLYDGYMCITIIALSYHPTSNGIMLPARAVQLARSSCSKWLPFGGKRDQLIMYIYESLNMHICIAQPS